MTQTYPQRAGQSRRAYRDTTSPIVGGVAAGLAAHLAVPVLWVRCFFVATGFLGGFGLLLYAGLWVFLPADQCFEVSAPGLESATRTGKCPGRRSRLRRRPHRRSLPGRRNGCVRPARSRGAARRCWVARVEGAAQPQLQAAQCVGDARPARARAG